MFKAAEDVKLTNLEMMFIGMSYNEWGWLDDTAVDFTDYVLFDSEQKGFFKQAMKNNAKEATALARRRADRVKGAVKASLEKKGVIGFEEHRPEDEGGDLYFICEEFEYLFEEA